MVRHTDSWVAHAAAARLDPPAVIIVLATNMLQDPKTSMRPRAPQELDPSQVVPLLCPVAVIGLELDVVPDGQTGLLQAFPVVHCVEPQSRHAAKRGELLMPSSQIEPKLDPRQLKNMMLMMISLIDGMNGELDGVIIKLTCKQHK